MQRIGAQVDANGDNVIQLDEFRAAMMQWLEASRMHTAAYTDADTDSAQIAASVASFFSQFETQENLPLIKQKLAQQLLAEEGSDGAVEEDFDTFWQCGRAPVPLSAKEKLQYLENLENSLKTQVVVQTCQRLAHDDPGERLGACVALIRSLRILEIFPTPNERYSIRAWILELFKQLEQGNFAVLLRERMLLFHNALDVQTNYKLILAGLEALYLFTPGPMVPHLTDQHPGGAEWQMQKLHSKRILLNAQPILNNVYTLAMMASQSS